MAAVEAVGVRRPDRLLTMVEVIGGDPAGIGSVAKLAVGPLEVLAIGGQQVPPVAIGADADLQIEGPRTAGGHRHGAQIQQLSLRIVIAAVRLPAPVVEQDQVPLQARVPGRYADAHAGIRGILPADGVLNAGVADAGAVGLRVGGVHGVEAAAGRAVEREDKAAETGCRHGRLAMVVLHAGADRHVFPLEGVVEQHGDVLAPLTDAGTGGRKDLDRPLFDLG